VYIRYFLTFVRFRTATFDELLRSTAGYTLDDVPHDDFGERLLTKTNATTQENTDSALSPPCPTQRTNRTGETLSGCGSRWLVLEIRFQVENNMSPCMAQ